MKYLGSVLIGKESLHQNTIFLIVSQAMVSLFGYLFWIIAARYYNSAAIGITGTLISTSTLIAQVSILGLNNAVVRFLPHTKDKNSKINTCLALITLTSLLCTLVCFVWFLIFIPRLSFVVTSPSIMVIFSLCMVLTSINVFTDSVFLAYRATKYNLIIYGFYSLVRVLLPLMLVGLGASGLFAAHVAGTAVAAALSFAFMKRKFDYRPSITLDFKILNQIKGYSLKSYMAGFLWTFPILIAPQIIIRYLDSDSAAYFYMSMTLVSALSIIPLSSTQSLFAEGSHAAVNELMKLVRKSLLITFGLNAVATVSLILVSSLLLSALGQDYANNSKSLLILLAVTGLVSSINMTGNVVLKILQKVWLLISVALVGCVITISSFLVLLPLHGLNAIGWGSLAGQAAMAIIYGVMVVWSKPNRFNTRVNNNINN